MEKEFISIVKALKEKVYGIMGKELSG